MKTILALALFTLTFTASAFPKNDSVAVFHRPEKVIIQVNEGYDGYSRLSDMMDFLGVGNKLQITSADQNIAITCGRNREVASCIFRFLPAENIKITHKKLDARANLKDLKLDNEGAFIFHFVSSMEDRFMLKIVNGIIYFQASKRILEQ